MVAPLREPTSDFDFRLLPDRNRLDATLRPNTRTPHVEAAVLVAKIVAMCHAAGLCEVTPQDFLKHRTRSGRLVKRTAFQHMYRRLRRHEFDGLFIAILAKRGYTPYRKEIMKQDAPKRRAQGDLFQETS